MANLFTGQTPESADNSDGTPGITSAVTVVFAGDGVVAGVRIFTTTTVGGTYTGALWQVTASDPGTGTLLASKVYAGATPAGGAWLDIAFDDPVPVTAGTAYRAGVHNSEGRYVATLGFFDEALTNGDISAPAHNGTAGGFTVSQGVFRIDAAIGYPNSPGGGQTNYFADVSLTPDFAGTVSPNGLAVPVALGAPTITFSAGAEPAGLAAPVALGAPAAAFSATDAAPAGVAVPVALGAPAVRHYVRPDGIGASVHLGAPTVSAPPGPVPEVETGSWDGLLAVINSARADARVNAERRRHPVECPYDGWPLKTGPDGALHCQFGGHVITPSY